LRLNVQYLKKIKYAIIFRVFSLNGSQEIQSVTMGLNFIAFIIIIIIILALYAFTKSNYYSILNLICIYCFFFNNKIKDFHDKSIPKTMKKYD
jgi:hypothetical protein